MRGPRCESSENSETESENSGGESVNRRSPSPQVVESPSQDAGERVTPVTIPRVKIKVGAGKGLMTAPPVQKKGKGKKGAAGSGRAEPADGRPSGMTDKRVGMLRKKKIIPDDVEVIVPGSDSRPWDCPEGYVCLYESYFKICKLWLPLPKVLIEYCERREMAISQLTAVSICNIVSLLLFASEGGVNASVRHLEDMSVIKKSPGTAGHYYLSFKSGMEVVTDKSSNLKGWQDRYFYARLTKSSARDPSRKFYTEWNYEPGGGTVFVIALVKSSRFIYFPDFLGRLLDRGCDLIVFGCSCSSKLSSPA